MQKLVTSLWYDTDAEEAANLYVSLFDNSKITYISHYGESAAEISNKPAGSVLTVEFELAGQQYTALNGGPQFPFTEAISIAVNCDDQGEVDQLWVALTADGGQEGPCGWLKDKFGLSWQIVPTSMQTMMTSDDEVAKERMMAAMLKMHKLDAAELERAYNG